MIHGDHVTSFGICYDKSDDLGRFGNRFNGMSAIQPEQASAPEPAAQPKKVDLQKLMDQFDISGAFDWLNSHRAANKNKEAGE